MHNLQRVQVVIIIITSFTDTYWLLSERAFFVYSLPKKRQQLFRFAKLRPELLAKTKGIK